MARYACVLWVVGSLFLASSASAAPFSFTTGTPDGRLAAATRIEGGGLIEIEAADDFITTADQTTITSATFFGLLPATLEPSVIQQVVLEIYRVFPFDSDAARTPHVPTRTNSPSDVAFDSRVSGGNTGGENRFTVTSLGAFSAANSVVNGINPQPNQTTHGEGAVSGTQVRIDMTLTQPFRLPPGHYFFVPQVRLPGGNTFLWLSATGNNPPQFIGDLQAWIRNANLDPDWLRIGTDIIGGSPAPTFNMAFMLTGTTEAATLAAAVLPSSRSVLVGSPATAFVTVINPGTTTATGVDIHLNTGIPANFAFQTTDPTTNVPTGNPNTPVNIAPGGRQTFVVAITPTQPFPATDVQFAFGGGNAPVISGVDTLLLSASATPVPDIVAIAATLTNDGVVTLPSPSGNAAFAVATTNVGVGGDITVSADTGTANVPVLVFVCQTNPGTGQCLASPSQTVSLTIGANERPTFGVFVAGLGNAIPFDPAHSRVFVRFKDTNGGATRGATSVAVRTP